MKSLLILWTAWFCPSCAIPGWSCRKSHKGKLKKGRIGKNREEKGFFRKILHRRPGGESGSESGRELEITGGKPLTIRDSFRSEYFDVVFADDISDERNLEIFSFAAASPRFRDLPVINLEADTDAASETQFAAMSFVLDPDTVYIAFRGTDRDLLGWKEDFNMSFMEEVPAQALAADYINRNYGSGNPRGSRYKLMIGGHSKGETWRFTEA